MPVLALMREVVELLQGGEPDPRMDFETAVQPRGRSLLRPDPEKMRHLMPVHGTARQASVRLSTRSPGVRVSPVRELRSRDRVEAAHLVFAPRSEERRVGKECRSRWAADD